MPRLTLWGINQYLPELFQGIVLPVGVNKEVLLDTIFRECGQQYPYHQNPNWLRTDISLWFQAHLEEFDRMYKALTIEYNPIENYDRHENSHRDYDHSGNDKSTLGGSDTATDVSHVTTTPDLTNETNVSAYDQTGYAPREQLTQSGNTQTDSNGTNTVDYGKTDNMQYGHEIDDTFTSHIHGNIGVTTNQQMINQELEMRKKENIYMIITRMFEAAFLVRVY